MWRYVGSRASIEADAPPAVRGGLAAPADKQSPLPWRRVAGQAALIWLATRAAYAAFTLFAVTFSSGSRQLGVVTATPTALLHAWQHWDAHWYLRIAALGYYNIQPAAFFPLYPALIHVGSLVVGANHALAVAMLIGNLGTLGAFIAVALLAVHETGDDEGAWRTLRLLIAFPLAFFLFAPYTEGIFLGLAAATLLCIRRGSWRWAALWAFLAGLTRPTSVALVLPMAWEYGRQHGWWTRAWWRGAGYRALQGWRALAEVAAVVGAVPAAFTLYALYCWAQLGHPLALLNSQREYWGHRTVFPGQAILIAAQRILAAPFPSDLQTSLLVNFVPLVAFIVILAASARRLPLAYTLYTAGVILLSVASPIFSLADVLTSVGRYMLAAVPIFLVLAEWSRRRPWLESLLVTGGLLVQAMLALVYLRNGLVN